MRGAVAAGHRLTAEAGAEVLAAGGNAVDACIAAALVSWVTESPLTGPGAGGYMLVHRARDGRDTLLDFFVAIPGHGGRTQPPVEMEPVDVPFGTGDTTQVFLVGAASSAVPGMVAGLSEAYRRFGSLPWERLVSPAARLARVGVELSPAQALLHDVLDGVLRKEEDGRRAYGELRALRTGERLVLADLAGTLDQLAHEGPAVFYRGHLARRIARASRERGGGISEEDLAAYRVVRRKPVRAAYRGHMLVSNPPPSSGGVLIAFALRLLDRLGAGGPQGSASALARLAEVFRETTRARTGGFTRELHRGGLSRRLLSDDYVAASAARVSATERVPLLEPAGLPSTTHVSVVDARGNAASLSSSTGCGSGFVVPGTGIHLNNMLGELDLNPPGASSLPGMRLTSMMAPAIVLHSGRPRLVLGSAGSERLRAAIVQTVVNVVDHGLGIAEAIERPRVHLDGEDLHVEGGTEPVVADHLAARGYKVTRWPGEGRSLYFGGVSAVGVRGEAELEASGDVRRGGHGVVVGGEANGRGG